MKKPAERVINADPEAWCVNTAEHMGPEAYNELRAALRDPEVVHSMIEDYRAGLTVDREADDADRAAGRNRVPPPGRLADTRRYGRSLRDVVGVWRPWADDLRGIAIDSDHHMADEAPDDRAEALLSFFGRDAPNRHPRPSRFGPAIRS